MIFMEPILRALGQDEKVIENALTYIYYNLPGAYFAGMFDLQKRFLNCFKMTWIPMIIAVLATCIHLLWCKLFVIKLEMGIAGIGLAYSATSFSSLVFTVIFSYWLTEVKEALSWPDTTIWSGWKEYLGLAVPTAGTSCADWWSFQLLIILAGILGVK